MKLRPSLIRPAIFGLADGCMSLLGVILYLMHDPKIIFPAALSGAISSAVSMAGGEFLSDSDNGLWPSIVMGLATGAGAILPAIPFALGRGPDAIGFCVAICLAIAVIVGTMRGVSCQKHKFGSELAGTVALLGVIFAVVLTCALVFPSPG